MMRIDFRFDSHAYHRDHPLYKPTLKHLVNHRISEGAKGSYEFPDAEAVAVLVDGFDPTKHPRDCLDKLYKSLLLTDRHYPQVTHAMVRDETMSKQQNCLSNQGDTFATVPVCIMRALSSFGYYRLSTITLSYVTVPLLDLQYFTKHTLARIIIFDNLRVSEVGSEKLGEDMFEVFFDVSKMSFKGMLSDLVASLVLGCKEQHSLFIELEAKLLTDALCNKVRGVFRKTHILQLNSGRFSPGMDLFYRQGDYNKIVDLRFSNIEMAPADYCTFLGYLRQSASLRQFVLEGWKTIADVQRDAIHDLFCALDASSVTKIHFEKVPFEFVIVMEWGLDHLKLNDVFVCTLLPRKSSLYGFWPENIDFMVKAVLNQIQLNPYLGVIHDDKQRSDAYEKRCAGFCVEHNDGGVTNTCMFTAYECQQITNHCCRNYNSDYLRREREELSGVSLRLPPLRLQRDIDVEMEEPSDNDGDEEPIGFNDVRNVWHDENGDVYNIVTQTQNQDSSIDEE